MLKKVLRMSHSAARPAEMHASKIATAEAAEAVRCSMLFALPAEDPARFPSSRAAIALFIAAIALASRDKETDKTKTSERTSLLLFPPALGQTLFRRQPRKGEHFRRLQGVAVMPYGTIFTVEAGSNGWARQGPAGAPTAIRLGADLSNMNTKTAHGFPWAVFICRFLCSRQRHNKHKHFHHQADDVLGFWK